MHLFYFQIKEIQKEQIQQNLCLKAEPSSAGKIYDGSQVHSRKNLPNVPTNWTPMYFIRSKGKKAHTHRKASSKIRNIKREKRVLCKDRMRQSNEQRRIRGGRLYKAALAHNCPEKINSPHLFFLLLHFSPFLFGGFSFQSLCFIII